MYDSNATNTAASGDALISSYTANTNSTTLNVTNGLWIETSTKGYITSIVWTPASDDITMTTTATMDGWRAFYDASQAYTIKTGETNTKAYIAASVGDDNIVLKPYTGTIYKSMPVILHTTRVDHTIILTKNASNDTFSGDNELKATTAGQSVDGVYRLGYGDPNDGGVGVGFYPWTSSYAAAGIVYVEAETLARALTFVFDEETTGISDVRGKMEDVRGNFYDLSGRRVVQPTKGLYIVNGRKVVIK